jgi:AAT family amino acid transporter/GABA permease
MRVLASWPSYAVVIALVGVLAAMRADVSLQPQWLAGLASLAVASAAYLLAAKRATRGDTATGYLLPLRERAMEGRK